MDIEEIFGFRDHFKNFEFFKGLVHEENIGYKSHNSDTDRDVGLWDILEMYNTMMHENGNYEIGKSFFWLMSVDTFHRIYIIYHSGSHTLFSYMGDQLYYIDIPVILAPVPYCTVGNIYLIDAHSTHYINDKWVVDAKIGMITDLQ